MELTPEQKAALEALKGVPAAVKKMEETHVAALKARDDRIEKLEADIKALASAGSLDRQDTRMVLPVYREGYRIDDRTPEQKRKEGEFDWTAFLRMVVLGSRVGGPEQAAFYRVPRNREEKAFRNAGFTYETVMEATERKAMTFGTGSAGGYVVPDMQMTKLIEELQAQSICIGLGVEVWEGLAGVVKVPRETSGGTGYWVGEGSAVTDSSLGLDQPSLSPKIAGAMTKVSNMLLNWSNPKAGEMIRKNLVRKVTNLIDLAILRGSGSSNQPRGIANTSSIITVAMGTNGDTPSWAKMKEMHYKLNLSNVPQEKNGFAMHPRSLAAIEQWKDSQNRPYFVQSEAGVQSPTVARLFGFPIRTTTQIPINLTKGTNTDCSEIYLTDWAQIVLGMWGGLEVSASSETYDAFEKLMTWILVAQLVDVCVKCPAACIYMADARG